MVIKKRAKLKTLKNEKLTLMDAVDNLSSMAELDTVSAEEAKETGIEQSHAVKWLTPSEGTEKQEEVKETFRVLHKYLQHVYQEERSRLKDPETQKGIQAIMVLAGEAASKVDRYTDIFLSARGKKSVSELKEFQDLQKFYLSRIIKRFQETLEAEEEWHAEWGTQEEDILDIERRGLKDIETVRRDQEYELFYLRKEDGRLFFNRNLLRHIRLVGDFDEAISVVEEGDPFLKVKILHDREINTTSKEMLNSIAPFIDKFYKEALRYKDKPFVNWLNQAIMALMLAANARNSIQRTTSKSCLLYFCDFHTFLRQAILSDEYQRYILTSHEEMDPFHFSLLNLSHTLCMHFFFRVVDPKECIDFIYKLIGEEKRKDSSLDSSKFFNTLLDEDERLRAVIKQFPNGPILKTLDVLKQKGGEKFFDPLAQENFPYQLFNFELNAHHITCIHLPCPVHQEVINRVQIVEEFKGLLRAMSREMGGKKLLMINLQDRTSWQEHARCTALEDLQKEAEFSRSFYVISLPKNTDFYLQSSSYLKLDDATDFKKQLLLQVKSGPECGFFFPQKLDVKTIIAFSEELIETIHKAFFDNKKSLTRTNRLDFIEIFYLLLIYKLVEWIEPDAMSFSCKDGIDVGAAAAAGFYLFVRLFSDESKLKRSIAEKMLWMLHGPAILVRERCIHIQRFHRMISSLSHVDAKLQKRRKTLLKELDVSFKDLNLRDEGAA